MAPSDPATTPFSKLMGVSVTEATAERVVGALEVRPELCAESGVLHGGAAMALADLLGGIGAKLGAAADAAGAATVESRISFSAFAGPGDTLRAEATPVHRGDRLSVWETRITRADGKLVALATQTQLAL